jgi:hypothetical protein
MLMLNYNNYLEINDEKKIILLSKDHASSTVKS